MRMNSAQRNRRSNVILRESDEGGPAGLQVVQITASPYEAQDYADSGEEIVEKVPMPQGLLAWVAQFVEAHHIGRSLREAPSQQGTHGPQGQWDWRSPHLAGHGCLSRSNGQAARGCRVTRPTDFWARRRAAVKAEAEAEAQALAAVQAAERDEAAAEKDDTEILAELGLPDPQTLEAGDDFSAFLCKKVPEHLRRRALRRLWRSNPVLACVDGLNEYDDDYRAAMLLQGPVQTAYQVGKGMLKHVEEMERQAQAEARESEVEDFEIAEVQADDEVTIASDVQTETLKSTEVDTKENAIEPLQNSATAPVRRMRFRFEEVSA